MTQSRTIDGIALSDQTDFASLAHQVLRGDAGGAQRGDAQPLDWILRAYSQLAGSPLADGLSRGVAACLTAPEPEVRGQALVFFQSQARAAGGDRISELVRGDRKLFRGVDDPIHPGTDLEWQLLTALAARVGIGDPSALDLAKAEVEQPGRAAPLVAELAGAAPDWVIAHAEAIVKATPASGATLLIQLQTNTDVVALGRKIARWCHGDPRFETDISRFIDDPTARQRLLSLFRGSLPS
jgi:hypothetical protein